MDHRRNITSLESARFLTNRDTIREYEATQVQIFRQPGYFERKMQSVKFRIFIRTIIRFFLFILAITFGLAGFYVMTH